MAVDQPKPRPKGLVKQPKYSQGQGLGDVELRADLEKYMYGNPLARLGYELYKEGKINVDTISPYNSFGTLGRYISPRLASKTRGTPTKGLLQYIPRTTFTKASAYKDKEEINPLLTFIHELSHAGAEVVRAKGKNRRRNIEDEYSFEGKQNSPPLEAGFNEYGSIDYEEGVVRAGDKLIEARAEGGKNISGSATLDNYLNAPGFGEMDNTPENTELLKQRFLDLSKAAQNILNERGVPPEAIAPSDNREKSFMKSFKDFLGLERERNKLNNLGFARPIDGEGNVYDRDIYKSNVDSSDPYKLKEGGTLMAATGLTPLLDKTSNPTGNKPKKEKKMPQRGAKPTTVDPRDEALKLVAKKMKQDKTQIGIATPTGAMPMDPTQEMVMPMPMSTALAAPDMPMNPEEVPMPIKAAKGKAIEDGSKTKKKGKGLAVVIEMGSAEKPEYEEASMGTPSDPPPGATSDEVKDNQHVLLSEGELVVPANVVRYHGLGMYEGMRREALQGLGEMEDAGQVEYMDDEVKTAAAGMTIMNAQPNVATLSGIQKQQGQYNPSLGQYGTAAAPQAASAQFVSTGFVDRNKDGIDDKLQPSVVKTPVATPTSTSITTPAGLAIGPTTDANTVVGAGNVGSYVAKQSGVPGSGGGTTPPAEKTPAPVAPTRVVQQQSSGDDDGDPEINAGLGGARATIAGQEYALQYDFSGNVTGIANVADALTSGRANFIAPNPELAMDLLNMTKGQINMLSGGLYAKMAGTDIQNRQQTIALAEKIKAGNYGGLGMRQQDMPMPRPAGLGTSTMPRVETAPVSPVNRQLAFGAGEKLGGAFGTTDVDYNPNTMVEGLLSPEAPKVDITNLGSIDGPANEAARARDRASKMGIDGPAITPTQPFQQAYDYNDDVLPDTQVSRAGIDGPANAAFQSSKMGIDGPANAPAIQQSRQMFGPDRYAYDYNDDMLPDRPTADLPGVGGAMSSQAQQARDQAFREEAEAKSRKEDRDAQMRGIGMGFAASTVAPGTPTNDAIQDKGYSSTGAAPAGSQYSSTGTFSSSNSDDDNSGDLGGATGAGYGAGSEGTTGEGGTQTSEETKVDPTAGQDLSRTFADDSASGDTGGGKIVCTEMYRQTQLDDWAQAMKTWHIYQKKYLTPIHEIGYHSLFKPFVRGMKVNKALTNLGAYLAKERTKHLRHILTKGKAKDSIVGNVFCKIIHPIVYLVGLAVHKK